MKTDIWMPIYIGDYLKDTRHLTTEEHGAYFLILLELWNKGGSLKKSLLPRIAPTNGDFYAIIWPSISEFFIEDNDGNISQKRLTKELQQAEHRRLIAAENGRKGGRPKKPIGKPTGKPMANLTPNPEETSSPSSSPSPIPLSKPKKKKENLVVEDIDYPTSLNLEAYKKFERYRQQGKHPLTAAAKTIAIQLLTKYSKQVQAEMVDKAILSGWRGLFEPKQDKQEPKMPEPKRL